MVSLAGSMFHNHGQKSQVVKSRWGSRCLPSQGNHVFGAGVVLQCRSSNLVHRLCLKPTLQLVWCEYDFLKVYPVVQRMPPFPCVGRFPSKTWESSPKRVPISFLPGTPLEFKRKVSGHWRRDRCLDMDRNCVGTSVLSWLLWLFW